MKKEPEHQHVAKREPKVEMENLDALKPRSVERAAQQVVIDKIETKREAITPFDVKQEDQNAAMLAAAKQQ